MPLNIERWAGSMALRLIASGLVFSIFLNPASRARADAAASAGPALAANSVTTQTTPFSMEARAFLEHPVDRQAFERGLALIKNSKDSARSRQAVLGKLHASRRAMDAGQLRALRSEATAIAKDSQEPPGLSAQAIGTLASVNLRLLERSEITSGEARQEVPFLLGVAQDSGRDREMRGRAIRALADLQATEAAPALQRLLADPANHNLPQVAQNGCLALGRLSPKDALPAIVGVMSRTADRSVFGSGAFALGNLGTAEAMAALIQFKDRFPDLDSCEAALSGMENVILATLRNPQDPHLAQAIQATRQLWKKSQREQYVPLLRNLCRSGPLPARAQAVERLINAAATLDFTDENRELTSLLGLIADQKDLDGFAERIRRRLAARPLSPTGMTLPVPSGAKTE